MRQKWKAFDIYALQDNLPQAVWSSFGTLVVPSHGGSASQFVAFETEVFIVFPVQRVQECPFLKYPQLHTLSKKYSILIILLTLPFETTFNRKYAEIKFGLLFIFCMVLSSQVMLPNLKIVQENSQHAVC